MFNHDEILRTYKSLSAVGKKLNLLNVSYSHILTRLSFVGVVSRIIATKSILYKESIVSTFLRHYKSLG